MTTLQSPPADSPALLDVRAVAELCGCSTRHVYCLADAGRMPALVKLGALVCWPRAAIEDWTAAGFHRRTQFDGILDFRLACFLMALHFTNRRSGQNQSMQTQRARQRELIGDKHKLHDPENGTG